MVSKGGTGSGTVSMTPARSVTVTLVGTVSGILGGHHRSRVRPAALPRRAGYPLAARGPHSHVRRWGIIPESDLGPGPIRLRHRPPRRPGSDGAGHLPHPRRLGLLPHLDAVEYRAR